MFFKKNRTPETPEVETEALVEVEAPTSEVRMIPAKMVGLGEEFVAVLPVNGDPHAVLETQEAEILRHCADFDSIEDHAARYCTTFMLDSSHRKYIETVLRGLVERRLLLDKAESGNRWPSAGVPPHQAIRHLSTITSDRVETARRCFSSFAENLSRHQRSCDLVVVDNSTVGQNLEGNQAWLRQLNQTHDLDFYYCGPAEKTAFIEEMKREGVPGHVLDFALLGVPEADLAGGSNRNTQLLLFAGLPFFSVDDDVICRIAPSEALEDRLDYDPGLDPTDFEFFTSRDQALSSPASEEVDIVGEHERLIGRELRSLVGGAGGGTRLSLETVDDQLLTALELGRGRVAVTSNGIMGDSGMGLTRYPLYLQDENREALIWSEEDYDAYSGARNVRRCSPGYVLSSSRFLMTTSVSLDSSALLPPFFPVNRNTDGIFGDTLRAFDRYLFTGHLPFAIAHDPPVTREISKEENLHGATSLKSSDFVRYCLKNYEGLHVSDDPRRKMMALGEHLKFMGSLSPSDFREYVRESWVNAVGIRISTLEHSLALYDHQPPFWAEDIYRYVDRLRQSLREVDEPNLERLGEGVAVSETPAFLRLLIERFGELLVYWPDIVSKAQERRERMGTFARRV